MKFQRYLKEKYYYSAFGEDIYQNPDSKELARIRENVYTLELSPYVAVILYGKTAIVFSDNILHSELIPKLRLNKDNVITIRLAFSNPRTIAITTSDTMRESAKYADMDEKEMEAVVVNHPWIKKFNIKSFDDIRN